MQIQSVALSELNLDPSNVRKHDGKNLGAIKGSLAKFGQQKPIVVDAKGIILAGNGTYAAAKELGWDKIDVVRTDLEGPEAIAYAIADNRSSELAEWDIAGLGKELEALDAIGFDLEAIGFDEDDLAKMLPEVVPEEGLTDADAIPDNVDTRCRYGDLWTLDGHRLLCGDSTNIQHVERLMAGEKADMVFTDPPYGVAVVKSGKVGADFGIAKKGKYSEVIGDETTDTAEGFYNTSIAFGFNKFIIWGGNYFTKFLDPSNSWVIWNKRADSGIRNTFADAELAWSNCGFPARVHNQLWNGMIRAGEKDARVHPTQKPIALAEFCFELSESKVIYDPFLGSGSTLIACEKTGRKCYGMEIDPKYCDVILTRWEQFTGKTAMLTAADAEHD